MNERDQSNQPESIFTTSKVLPWQIDIFAAGIALLVNLTQKKQTFLTLAAALLALAQAQAQTTNYFTGNTAAQWSTSGNWSQSSVPTSAQDVFSTNGTEARIGGTTAAVAGNLTIGGASGASIVSLRNDSANSLTVSGNITLAPGAGNGQLTLGTGTGFTSTLTIGGGTGSILDGGGAGVSRIAVYGHMGTLGLANATADELNINQNSSGSLTIGAGQTYTIGTTKVGSASANVTDALTVNGTLVSTTINPGANTASGTNDATFTLNTGGLVQATTLRRSGSQNITFNWNGGTIQNMSGGNLTVDATSGTLTIGLAGTGTHTFNADSGKTITVASTAVLADQAGQNGTLTKAGAGTLVLQGTNTYTGGTTVNAGTLQAKMAAALPSYSTGAIAVNNAGSVLAINAGNATTEWASGEIDNLLANGNVTFASGTSLGIDTTGGNFSYASNITKANMGLTKIGANTLTLNGSNTYTGTTTIGGGNLTANNASALGSGGNITFTGGALQYTASSNATDWGARIKNSSSAIVLDTNAQTVTLAGVIDSSNTGGLTLRGNGTLTLSGNNSYTGTTTIGTANSVLYANHANALGNGGNITFTAVGDLNYTANSSATDWASRFKNSTSLITLGTNGQNVVLNGVIDSTNTGGLRAQNTGSLTLNGNNSFSGPVQIISSNVMIANTMADSGSNSSLGTGSTIQIGNAAGVGTLRYTGAGNSTNRQIQIGGGALVTHTGGGFLESSGAGALVFTNATFNAYQTGSIIANRTFTLTGNNTGNNEIQGAITNNKFDGSGFSTTAGVVSLTKNGTGTWILSGNNTYTGNTTVSGGTLQAKKAAALPNYSTGTVAVNNAGSVLALNAGAVSGEWTSAEIDNLLANGNVTFASGTSLGIDTTGGNFSYASNITKANMGLTKIGANTLTLNGSNTYTGNTTVNGGTLQAKKAAALPNYSTGAIAVNNAGSVLALNAGAVSGEWTSGEINNLLANGNVTFASGTSLGIDTTGGNFSHASNITKANMGLTKIGANTLTLTGTNTYNGTTTISAGTLQLDGSTASASTVTIGTAGTLSGSGTVNGNATLTGGGIINKSSGTIVGKLDVTGGNWNGNGSVTGTVTSSSGTFTIGSGANLTANGGMNVSGGTLLAGNASSTITGNLNYTSSNSSTFQGILAGSGKTLTMNATGGMLTLTGNNTYTGTTNVTGGTLLVNGNQSAATGNVNVASGATLGGNGTLGGATTISGILSPGNGNIDTLNIASNVTWKGAASAGSSTDWIFDLGTSNASDLLNITGDFLKDTSLGTNFRFDFANSANAGTFTLVTWGGSNVGFTASDFSFTNLGGGLTGSFAFNGSHLEFSISAIPESSTWVGMAALVLSAVVMSRHRQRRNIL